MNRPLVTQLVLPLAAATVISVLVHLRWPADGFFLNLAAGFVGSLVTVGYVDWILGRHERERWKEADSRIAVRLRTLATATITGIRTTFGYGTDVFDRWAMASGDVNLMQAEVLRVGTHVLAPTAEARISAMNQEQWKSFIAHLQQTSMECGILLDRFGYRLNPSTTAILLDLQQALGSAQTFWRVFPDLAGVPTDRLPKTKTPPEELQAAWCEITARDIRTALQLSVQLAQEAK